MEGGLIIKGLILSMISLKMIMECSKNGRRIIPIRLRVQLNWKHSLQYFSFFLISNIIRIKGVNSDFMLGTCI